jgi:hypothetical protein
MTPTISFVTLDDTTERKIKATVNGSKSEQSKLRNSLFVSYRAVCLHLLDSLRGYGTGTSVRPQSRAMGKGERDT